MDELVLDDPSAATITFAELDSCEFSRL